MMLVKETLHVPEAYIKILALTVELGFTMPSDIETCSFLRTMASSKRRGRFLELGTGTGLSTCWILSGMDAQSSLVSIDNDSRFLNVAIQHMGFDSRVEFILTDGEDWIGKNRDQRFDYIFADTWHGKYLLLNEVIEMLNPGGLYLVDDMLPQSNWPEGHQARASTFSDELYARHDLMITTLPWATGIILAVKK